MVCGVEYSRGREGNAVADLSGDNRDGEGGAKGNIDSKEGGCMSWNGAR